MTKINKMQKHLYLTGQKRDCSALHMHKTLDRHIIAVEDCRLHLMWQNRTIYIKTCPSFLLDYDMWMQHLVKDSVIFRNALGFLRSYVSLVRRESDMLIARGNGLLPPNLDWQQWLNLSRSFLRHIGSLWDAKHQDRWTYGELRLGRLNMINRFCFCSDREPGQLHRGLFNQYRDYGSNFRRHFSWIAASSIYSILVLTALQVGLATGQIGHNAQFMVAAEAFTISVLLALLAALVLSIVFGAYIFLDNALFTLKTLRSNARLRSSAPNLIT